MNCSHCGQPNDPGSVFCANCGSQLEPFPEQPQSQPYDSPPPSAAPAQRTEAGGKRSAPKKGKTNIAAIVLGIVSVLLAVVIVLMSLGVTDAVFAPQQKGFDEPEDAIAYFIDHVKSGDIEGAMAACAVDEVSGSYDYEAMLDRLRAMSPSIQYLPSEYELYAAYNEISLKNQIMRQLSYMALSVVLPDEYSDFLTGIPIYGEAFDFDDVVDDMDPGRFMELEVTDIGEADIADNDTNRKNMRKQAEMYGADDMVTRDVLYDIDGDYYAGGVMLLEYDSGWLILSLNDPLLNQPYTGALIPLDSKSDFDDLLGGDYTGPEESTPSAATTESTAPTVEVSEETPAESAEAYPESFYMGVVLPSSDIPYFSLQAQDIAAAAEAAGIDVTICYAELDVENEKEHIENLIFMGIDILVISPLDPAACVPAVMKAQEAGIAVALINDNLTGILDDLYSVSIGYDFYNAAYVLAEWVADHLGDDIKIGELTPGFDYPSIQLFSEALQDVASDYPDWDIVSSAETGYDLSTAMSVASDMLAAHPNIDVIFCYSDYLALSVAEAVEQAGLDVTVVAIGGAQDELDAVADGTLGAVSVLDPHIGEMLIDVSLDLLSGRDVYTHNLIPTLIVDASNAGEMANYGY